MCKQMRDNVWWRCGDSDERHYDITNEWFEPQNTSISIENSNALALVFYREYTDVLPKIQEKQRRKYWNFNAYISLCICIYMNRTTCSKTHIQVALLCFGQPNFLLFAGRSYDMWHQEVLKYICNATTSQNIQIIEPKIVTSRIFFVKNDIVKLQVFILKQENAAPNYF